MSRKATHEEKVASMEQEILKASVPLWAVLAAERGSKVALADGREVTLETIEAYRELERKLAHLKRKSKA